MHYLQVLCASEIFNRVLCANWVPVWNARRDERDRNRAIGDLGLQLAGIVFFYKFIKEIIDKQNKKIHPLAKVKDRKLLIMAFMRKN